jgi:hypothetical protein
MPNIGTIIGTILAAAAENHSRPDITPPASIPPAD